MSEPNKVKWRGVRPTNPEEQIPIKGYDKIQVGTYTIGTNTTDSTTITAATDEKWLVTGIWIQMLAGTAGSAATIYLTGGANDIQIATNSDSNPIASHTDPLLIDDTYGLKLEGTNADTGASHDLQYYVLCLKV